MRSNDAYLGFPHDVFCFTMIQEIVARSLGIGVGEYHHFASSLHLYEHDQSNVRVYLDEGFQNPTFMMPKMPSGCQNSNLARFLDVEQGIREGTIEDASTIDLPTYWRDLALVLLRHADTKFKRGQLVREQNFDQISAPFYRGFFMRRPTIAAPDYSDHAQQQHFELGDSNYGTN